MRRFYERYERLLLVLQMAGTLSILAFVQPNHVKTVALLAWWLVTFGPLSRYELALGVGVCVLFSAMDILTVRQGAFMFTAPDAAGLPSYEFFMWGFYLLHLRRMIRARRSRRPVTQALGLAVTFGLVFSLASDSATRFWGPLCVCAVALSLFHRRSDLVAFGYMLLVGALIEHTGVAAGLWGYPGQGGVPMWFAPMWAGIGILGVRLMSAGEAMFEKRSRAKDALRPIDILLVNSFNPRRRSLSDVFLDNGLATIQAYLEEMGFAVAIEDATAIGKLDAFSPAVITRPLRRITNALLDAREAGRSSRLLTAGFVCLQYLLDAVHAVRSHLYIRRIVRHVRKTGMPVVGIKVWYGNSFRWTKKFVRCLNKHCPEVITVAGGPHANLYHEDGAILRYSNFDLVVYSEGERTLAGIMSCVQQGTSRKNRLARVHAADLPNLIWRNGETVVKNEMERPCPELKPIPVYDGNMKGKVRIHTLVDGLGCDYNKCTFCPHKNIYRGYRKRDVGAIVDEMEAMMLDGVSIFRFASGDTPRHHALAIAGEIERRGLQVEFSMFHRATRNARKRFETLVGDYRVLIRAGLRSVFMGLETGDEDINIEVLGKNLRREDVVWSVRAIREARDCEELRCDVALSMIHPVPAGHTGLSWDEIRQKTLAVVLDAQPDSALVTPPCAFPGTDWFNRPDRYGFHLGENFTERLMNYEYVLYKPTDMWSAAEFSLEGHDARALLGETMDLRAELQRAGIPTDVGDENFLVLQASSVDLTTFKRETLADILSCNYEYSNVLYEAVDEKSGRMARRNLFEIRLPDEVPIPEIMEVLV